MCVFVKGKTWTTTNCNILMIIETVTNKNSDSMKIWSLAE